MDNSEPESSEDSELYEKLAGEGCLAKKDSFLCICGRYIRGLLLLVTQNHKLLMTPRSSVVKIRSIATMPTTEVDQFHLFYLPPIYNVQCMVLQVQAQLSEATSAASSQSPKSAKSSQ